MYIEELGLHASRLLTGLVLKYVTFYMNKKIKTKGGDKI